MEVEMPATQPRPKLAYSILEACEASSLGKTTIYSLIAASRLRAIRIGGRTVIPADSLNALLNGDGDNHIEARAGDA
jgi:excisionase family DNA binding protein